VLSRNFLADCHTALGAFAEGRALTAAGLQIAQAVAHPANLMNAYWWIGLLSLRQGDLARALPHLERAVSLYHEADLPGYFPLIAVTLGVAYTLVGRVAAAVPLLTQVGEQVTAIQRVDFQEFCRLFLGQAQMLAGRLEEAQVLAERALTHAHAHQERGNQAYALCLLGDIATRRDPPEVEQGDASYRQALALAEELGMRPLQAHCHRGLGTLYAATGQREQARAELATATAMYQLMEMTFWLPQTEAVLAQVEAG
jgi:tetratricopeptide (TPR) repeat protein